MKKSIICIIILILIAVAGGIFYSGYRKAMAVRQYANEVEKIVNTLPAIPPLAEKNYSSQIQYWQKAVNNLDEFEAQVKKLTPPKGSEKLASMVDEYPGKIRNGLSEIQNLALLEKVFQDLEMAPTTSCDEAKVEINSLAERIETDKKEIEKYQLGKEFEEKERSYKKAFDNYYNKVQQAVEDIKVCKDITYLDTSELRSAIKDLEKDVVASLNERVDSIDNLKAEIDRESSKSFVW